jgi:predicted unusual protein kinase regulating ubiquinone biosynthesis (AarF/ABC1/UbiB family)
MSGSKPPKAEESRPVPDQGQEQGRVLNSDQRPNSTSTSRWARLAKLGALAPKAIPFAAEAMKRAVGVNRTADDEAKASAAAMNSAKSTAQAMLKTLGEMKGLPLKLGQMASYVDGLAPPGYEEKFQEVLKQLQSKAPPLSAEAAWSVVTQELGSAPDQLFAHWEREPFAAASIGQVHRARTRSGELVAVKVQYPGIDKAIEADLKSLGMLERMISPIGRQFQSKETLEEVRAVFMGELDYGEEAATADTFRRIHADDPSIVIPKVHHSLTTRRVLTMGFQEGEDYTHFTTHASQEARNAAGAAIWRFMFRALYRHGILYADPHPGNYRFLPDGRVAFLDFGCKKVLPQSLVEGMKRLVTTSMDADEEGFNDVCVNVLGYDNTDAASYKVYTDYTRLLMQPFLRVPYKHTKEAARESVAFLVRSGRALVFKEGEKVPSLPKPIQFPPDHTFVNRLQWGLASIMGGLGAEGDYRALTEPFVRGPLLGTGH